MKAPCVLFRANAAEPRADALSKPNPRFVALVPGVKGHSFDPPPTSADDSQASTAVVAAITKPGPRFGFEPNARTNGRGESKPGPSRHDRRALERRPPPARLDARPGLWA